MTSTRLRSIVVAGGGLKGWLAASYLRRLLGPGVAVTLVQAKAELLPPAVAAPPSILSTFRLLGIEESTVLRECGATFRCATRIEGPSSDGALLPFYGAPDAPVDLIGVPFFPVTGRGFSTVDFWKRSLCHGRRVPFQRTQPLLEAFFRDHLAPRARPDAPRHGAAPAFGYHLDTVGLVGVLRDRGTKLGVEFVAEAVGGVEHDERGRLTMLRTASGRCVPGDLFVDCTGPEGSIHRAAGGTRSAGPAHQRCDRFVAVELPVADREDVPTYSTVGAMEQGWRLSIPLADRVVSVLTFDSRYADARDAEAALLATMGESSGAEIGSGSVASGRSSDPWTNNCVAIGTAASAVDDFQGTQLLMLGFQLAGIVRHLSGTQDDAHRAGIYNREVVAMHDAIEDFITAHYLTVPTPDNAFWREVRAAATPSARLAARLEAFDQGITTNCSSAGDPSELFDARSYALLLSGMGREPRAYPPILDHLDLEPFAQLRREQALRATRLAAELPTHAQYLRGLVPV
ncbi:MAG: hypothetical protein GC161_18600 [Planctomycetaceae bacterium]|nr:hypothetical protein [Planctomycetaceae bacterium]